MNKTRDNEWPEVAPGWILGEIYFRRSCNALEKAAWGHGGVTVPRDIHEKGSCGTDGHGLVGVVGLGWGWTW